jgi:hypothetical protein
MASRNFALLAQDIPHGHLAFEGMGLRLPLTVMRSARGFYLGTFDNAGPVSRESAEYWPTEDRAEDAMATGEWTQRDHP